MLPAAVARCRTYTAHTYANLFLIDDPWLIPDHPVLWQADDLTGRAIVLIHFTKENRINRGRLQD